MTRSPSYFRGPRTLLLAGFFGALAFRRRPLAGGIGITIMLICIVGAALWGARSGQVAAVWPRTVAWSHTQAIPGAPIASDVTEISRGETPNILRV